MMSKHPIPTDRDVTAEQNIDLTHYNALGIKAKAELFYDITSEKQLEHLYEKGLFVNQSPVVLGGGSNVLIKSDISSPVLKISIPGITIVQESDAEVLVQAGAGVNWHDLVVWSVENGFGGIENLALIPGTVGAAPIQNIGAYGVELKDVFHSLSAFMINEGGSKKFKRQDCRFGYRDSVFKNELKGKAIVTSVALLLKKAVHHSIEDSYYALQNYFKAKKIQNPGIQDVFSAVVDIRQSKLPDPKLIGNAGSFFKNPIVSKDIYMRILSDFPDMPSYEVGDDHIKIPAGWLIEKAGWKGKRIGNVGTYKNQALVIVNHGGATGEEIYNHAIRIKDSVKDKFGIELVPEVNVVE